MESCTRGGEQGRVGADEANKRRLCGRGRATDRERAPAHEQPKKRTCARDGEPVGGYKSVANGRHVAPHATWGRGPRARKGRVAQETHVTMCLRWEIVRKAREKGCGRRKERRVGGGAARERSRYRERCSVARETYMGRCRNGTRGMNGGGRLFEQRCELCGHAHTHI